MHLRRANQRGEDTTQTQRETRKRTNTHSDTLYVTERLGIDTREGKEIKFCTCGELVLGDQWTERERGRKVGWREKNREIERERERERKKKKKYNRDCS